MTNKEEEKQEYVEVPPKKHPDQETEPRPRRERKGNADMRRRQLVAATLDSVAKNGLARTTLATVAGEAGLSQGVLVFYFKSKGGLLAAALHSKYARYQEIWQAALDAAGPDPLDKLLAVVEADFTPELCDPEALATWFAFWGEHRFTPQYAEIAEEFDANRMARLTEVCLDLTRQNGGAEDASRAAQMVLWIDTFTDGLWQKLHLNPQGFTRETALSLALEFVHDVIVPRTER
ncbi:TetR family transcriptional regulator C-terminal domain-containing protein [Cribrihabitans sp. XS_ASV171]